MSHRRGRARLLLAALIAAFTTTVLTAAPPAFAHAALVSSTPADGSTLDAAPSSVVLEFDSALLDVGAVAVVTGSDGKRASDGTATITGRTLRIDTDPAAPPGVYTVAFRVISKDGHTVTSLVHYTVTGTAPTAVPSAAAALRAEEGSSGPVIWVLGGLMVSLVVGVGVVLLKR